MDLNRTYLFIAKWCTQVPESRCRMNRIVQLWRIREESLTLHNGNVCGSLKYNANCITSQALPKAFQAKRNIDVIKAIKKAEKRFPEVNPSQQREWNWYPDLVYFFKNHVLLKALSSQAKKNPPDYGTVQTGRGPPAHSQSEHCLMRETRSYMARDNSVVLGHDP